MKRTLQTPIKWLSILLVSCCTMCHAVTWFPFGPYGGDARALAADPHDVSHLYLGTTIGWILESRDGGKNWKRLAEVGKRDDFVIDNIVVDAADSRHLVVGAWALGQRDGGLYVSHDAGVTWTSNQTLAGQAVLALTASASDPNTLVAGTLKGVYRSSDGGTRWVRISEEGSKELHEVESIAIDPNDPKIIYAGTWHLPWKTTDGGEHWNNIKEGVIEDSDVFSIIVDPKDPGIVYASACSGIYKSDNGGGRFKKIQGIPSTARRTRVLMQDPNHLSTVYAGTTEGLWRSDDSGANWVRTTGPELIVNDVFVDPTDSTHVMIATDRGGVMASHDRGNTFDPSNAGFSARQITSFLTDVRHPAHVYIGVLNDKEWGGVFASENGGLSWIQESSGLGGRDVFSLGQASDGTILAGTAHGIYRLNGAMWTRAGEKTSATVTKPVVQADPAIPPSRPNAKKPIVEHRAKAADLAPKVIVGKPIESFDGSVYAIAQAGDVLYAATSQGLLLSGSAGESWSQVAVIPRQELLYAAAAKNTIVAAGLKMAIRSIDNGRSWVEMKLPQGLTQIVTLAVDSSGTVWVGGGEGVFATADGGATWDTPSGVYLRNINNIFYDAAADRVLITGAGDNTKVFAVHLPERSIKLWDSGWNLRFTRPVGDHLVGATLFNGVVVQPRMVDSAEVAKQ